MFRIFFLNDTATTESEGDELETHIENLLELYEAVRVKSELMDLSPQHRAILNCFEREPNYTHGGETGVLYVTAAAKLLNAMTLNRIGNNTLPRTAQAMGRRLEQAKWSTLKVLDETDDARLKRQGNKRRVGIFRPSEAAMDGSNAPPVHGGVLVAKAEPLGLPQ
jgi:hypothetical protein